MVLAACCSAACTSPLGTDRASNLMNCAGTSLGMSSRACVSAFSANTSTYERKPGSRATPGTQGSTATMQTTTSSPLDRASMPARLSTAFARLLVGYPTRIVMSWSTFRLPPLFVREPHPVVEARSGQSDGDVRCSSHLTSVMPRVRLQSRLCHALRSSPVSRRIDGCYPRPVTAVRTMSLNTSGRSIQHRCPAPSRGTTDAWGCRRARWAAFSYGTTRSAVPCTIVTGWLMSPAGSPSRRKTAQASNCDRHALVGVLVCNRSPSSSLNSSGCCRDHPAGKGPRHRLAGEVGGTEHRRRGPTPQRLGRDRSTPLASAGGGHQNQRSDRFRVAHGQSLRNVAAHRGSHHMGRTRCLLAQHLVSVVGHLLDGVATARLV